MKRGHIKPRTIFSLFSIEQGEEIRETSGVKRGVRLEESIDEIQGDSRKKKDNLVIPAFLAPVKRYSHQKLIAFEVLDCSAKVCR